MSERHHLTDKQIEKARAAPDGKRYILWDSLTPSLGLRVTDRGHKSFLVQRRVNGRMVKLTLGEYPTVSLAKARDEAREALTAMTRGIDPRQSRPAPVTASGLRKDSFEGAVESYIKREVEKNRRLRTQQEIVRTLCKVLVPKWGSLPLSAIGPRQVVDALDGFMDAQKPIMANRTLAILHRFFGWCIERHLIQTNPCANVRKPAKEQTRARVLEDDELREVWAACERLGWPFGPFFQALILTGQRRSEVASMRWGDIDRVSRQWMIAGSQTKNARDHVVPIAPAMQSLLVSAPRFGGQEEADEDQNARPIFTTNGKTGVSGFSKAKARLDADILRTRRKQAEEAGRDPGKVKPPLPWILHDLRRSCATGMARVGVAPHIIEMVLNHASGFRSGIVGVYQRHPYLEERRKALAVWAAHLESLTAPREPTGNVVAFRKTS
jgi:integrase